MAISFPGLFFSIRVDCSFQKFEGPWNHLVLLRLRELRDHSVSQFEKITQRFGLFVKSDSLGPPQISGSRETLLQNSLCRTQFTAPAFANDDAEHLPDVFLRLEKFFPLPFPDNAPDQAPTDQITQVTVGVPATDFELFHHFICAQRRRSGNQKRVDLRHGSIDSPGTTDHAPLADKFISRLAQGC